MTIFLKNITLLTWDMDMTHCDAESAVNDGSYKLANDDDLREMRSACLKIGGPNQSAVQRVQRIGEIIQTELDSREALNRLHASAPVISSLSDNSSTETPSAEDFTSNLWTENKLLRFIQDKIEESLELEYKSAAALSRDSRKTAEITKDVSAMANSAGGTLVYGLSEYQNDAQKHLPERLDPVNRRDFSKEWLEQIISQIRPRVANLKIYSVQLSSGEEHLAYVVEIPQGTTAHQAIDCRYYRRYNFQSVPMVDHEVRDILNRKVHPSIVVKARLVIYPRPNRDGACGRLIFDVNNSSDVFARYVVLVANVPLLIRGKLVIYDGATLNNADEGTGYKIVFSNHDGAPLFPHAQIHPSFDFRVARNLRPLPEKQVDQYKFLVYADSMPAVNGSFTFEEIVHPRS